jgi:hypothetical protein
MNPTAVDASPSKASAGQSRRLGRKGVGLLDRPLAVRIALVGVLVGRAWFRSTV